MQAIIQGKVSAEGQIISGNGFEVKQNGKGTGKYVVTFTQPFSTVPAVVATVDGLGQLLTDNAQTGNVEKDQAMILTGKSDGTPGDRAFSFVAVG